ncbi:CDP-glycerol glycerophosphotransferase family protein [Flavobacterium sp. JAS]|uniref:CDP-glycerol glycerophosphotransferase family protein n=1 Tax=Flavobacterium sp. JAS TaxID=2897329 RepID=UPI001E481B9B|nr:CDP-glycerol glycerophosphotransferase family protein [Flavobacterium sp. JAS]MCD0471098.1 CDP-glycerol glycerophosphotransferase family protein [Flavobacterium sp. JAS]
MAIKQNTLINDEVTIPEYKESVKEKFLRELICLSRLYYNHKKINNPTLLTNWNWNQKSFSKKVFYKLIEKSTPFFSSYDRILKLEKRYQDALRQNSFYKEVKEILQKTKPNVIFCSHQRALNAASIFAAAADLDIKTSTVIYSWDNLPKARLALRADNYLVWSDYMKKELELYYPEISSDSIHVTGTPQFEFYQDKSNIIDKETFYKRYNLDLNKKIICFSGDDTKTSPDDPSYLKDIAEEFVKGNLQNDYQILLRRCPVDFSGRFDNVVEEYGDLIKEASPLWYFSKSKEWSAVYPSLEDVKLLVSTAFYSDVVVNVGSTMAFDFGMFNKPCVFINYDQVKKNVQNWSVKTIYQFQHFKSMPKQDAVIWLNSKEEIIDKIIHKKHWNSTQSLMKWFDIVVERKGLNASLNISKILSQF